MEKSKWLIYNGEDVEVIYTTTPAEKSNDPDMPSFEESHNILEVKYCDVDILNQLEYLDIKELEEQLD